MTQIYFFRENRFSAAPKNQPSTLELASPPLLPPNQDKTPTNKPLQIVRLTTPFFDLRVPAHESSKLYKLESSKAYERTLLKSPSVQEETERRDENGFLIISTPRTDPTPPTEVLVSNPLFTVTRYNTPGFPWPWAIETKFEPYSATFLALAGHAFLLWLICRVLARFSRR